jgi:hypothetical protein
MYEKMRPTIALNFSLLSPHFSHVVEYDTIQHNLFLTNIEENEQFEKVQVSQQVNQ